MRAIMIMFDSLNKHMLPSYGCDWTKAKNFKRLAEKTVQFNNAYIGSMPCMPARRELHTGRLNFLHRSWGPLEPYDDSMPQILKQNGIHTHLATDHVNYWYEGGCNYHTRYSTHEFLRGSDGEGWKPIIGEIDIPKYIHAKDERWTKQDFANRMYQQNEEDHCQTKTFNNGLEFLNLNKDEDNWFLQVEPFDPHEPFFSNERYKKLYNDPYQGPVFDWPNYVRVKETQEEIDHMRYEYAALLSMCDENLGKILDFMDDNNMWDDTMLIVNTDHGFLLGEHEWWGKIFMPYYNEIANIPLFIWDPRSKEKNQSRNSLIQTIDIAPTLLDYFNLDIPKDMQGKVLKETIKNDQPVRKYAIFGQHGGHVCITDGDYVYMRAPVGGEAGNRKHLNNYTLMPSHSRSPFSVEELSTIELVDGFEFTKGLKLIKVKEGFSFRFENINLVFPPDYLLEMGSMLFDVKNDPEQLNQIEDLEIEKRLCIEMIKLMIENDSPIEQYTRLGLEELYSLVKEN